VVGCALIAGFRKAGRKVGAIKPIETGVGPGGPLDALALRAAAEALGPGDCLCVTGSVYLAGIARAALRGDVGLEVSAYPVTSAVRRE